MPDLWHSLYVSTDTIYPDGTTLSGAVAAALATVGYQRYDPFPGGIGTPPGLTTFVKLFVAPAQDGWVRVLGDPDPVLPSLLSQSAPVIDAWINDALSGIDVY